MGSYISAKVIPIMVRQVKNITCPKLPDELRVNVNADPGSSAYSPNSLTTIPS